MFICTYCSYTWSKDRPYCPLCGYHIFNIQMDRNNEINDNIEELESAEGSVTWEI